MHVTYVWLETLGAPRQSLLSDDFRFVLLSFWASVRVIYSACGRAHVCKSFQYFALDLIKLVCAIVGMSESLAMFFGIHSYSFSSLVMAFGLGFRIRGLFIRQANATTALLHMHVAREELVIGRVYLGRVFPSQEIRPWLWGRRNIRGLGRRVRRWDRVDKWPGIRAWRRGLLMHRNARESPARGGARDGRSRA